MDVMHNREIPEEYFILQVQERWTFLLYDMAGARNGLQDVSNRQSQGPKIKKNSRVAIWQLREKNQVGILFRKERNA